eukprot:TRINITY_DN17538_c0_g1_i1.p4 TRINITY_DN17538_c0_g1~~TRINITY_DN17538_c0_g1_i1.p4  ORF type:complete len:117 (-),score=59.68 TRINITY_DN17538_c0_g1_i1:30-380(-)
MVKNISNRPWKQVARRNPAKLQQRQTAPTFEKAMEAKKKKKRLLEIKQELATKREAEKAQRQKRVRARRLERQKKGIQVVNKVNPTRIRRLSHKARTKLKIMRINGLDLSNVVQRE